MTTSRPPRRPRPAPAGPADRRARPAEEALRLAGPRPRLRFAGVALALILVVFAGRLVQLQVVDASAYGAKAAVNRYVQVPLPADRGTITDRAGVALATTVDAYDITADPYLFTREQTGVDDAPEQAAELLSPIIGVAEDTLADRLATPNSRYVLLARQQSPQAWSQIKELKAALADKAAKGRGANVVAGVFAQDHSKRVYPAGDLAAAVLGFVTADGRGGAGLEQQLDTQLSGKDGKRTYAQSGGHQVPSAGVQEQPATSGAEVQLTLDRDIQWAAQSAITEQVKASKADGGYVIVQDVRNGQILAMASAPSFDPGNIAGADPARLGNPAVADAYEPGSVSKLMTMAAVLEEGVATEHTNVTVPGTLRRADRVFHDDVDHGTWHLTLNGVLAKSSNIGTILAAEQLGKDQHQANRVLYNYLKRFGIGQRTGLDFPGETSGILAKPQDWNAAQQYTIPFGQGLSLTALQATSVYSTVAAGGVRVEPTLVKGWTDAAGQYTPADEPERTRVISAKTARTLSRMLESVVDDEHGTGVNARIPGYRIAGKTGTANRVDPQTGRYSGYTASFMGFAPADQPRVTVSCVIQNPTQGSYFGGEICGPTFRKVMEFTLKSLGVPPSGVTESPLPIEW